MRKLLMLGVALATLGAAMPAYAASSTTDAAVGATAGAATGGTIGFFLGGPIGAIVGGWAGATIGAEAAVSETSVRFAGEHPVDVVYLDAGLDVGAKLGDDVTIYPIEGDDQFGYFYANDRVYIIDLESRAIVQSPGYLVSKDAVAFVEANPTASVTFNGELAPGAQLDGSIELSLIPDQRTYKYVYVDDHPVLVDANTRTIVWVG